MPSKHPRIAVTADPGSGMLLSVCALPRAPERPMQRWYGGWRLRVRGPEVQAGRGRRTAAEALFAMMDSGGFDLDLDAIDRLNGPASAT